MTTLQPQTQIGGYELRRLLGEGGMGEVWLAQDMRADRPVALKFIKPHLLADAGFRKRFINEAKTLGILEHDRIVMLYNVVDADGHLALVLRFIDGESLADRIEKQKGPLPLNFVLSCVRDVLPALQFAHEKGIIHRDIKPENILVDHRDRCFLMDFGIAVAAFAERGTMTGFAIGTPKYMSPEQIRTPWELTPDAGGHRSDIYSFGVVLYEMLSGCAPIGTNSDPGNHAAIQRAHCEEIPSPLHEVNGAISAAVEEVVMSCLAKEAVDRPQSCEELLQRLEAAAQAGARPYSKTVLESKLEKVEAKPVLPPPAVKRRSKVPQGAWVAAGALCIAGGIGYTVMQSNSHSSNPPPAPPHLDNGTTSRPTVDDTTTKQLTDHSTIRREQIRNAGPTRDPLREPQRSKVANPEAALKYQSAQQLYNDGSYCESLSEIKEAVSLEPNPKYLALQKSAANGCNATAQ